MPISALPQETVRLIGSCAIITGPQDVVKELIDNAIDAKATSIEVTISPDSLDKLIVRDDGHGIDVEDFECLGRRSHTSKIEAFDELMARGGETLGFRGEALAAINSLANVTISTKTRRDPVATRMQLKMGIGGIDSSTKISAPVGTTVHVSKLFAQLPARRQYALKNGAKSIIKIQDLMKTYALARPSIRLLFKVRGDLNSNWSYAPNKLPTVREAALQIYRKDLASNCLQVSHYLAIERLLPLQKDGKTPANIVINALVPSPDCNGETIQGKGAHISVDSRPISSASSFAKKLVKIFKRSIANVKRSYSSTGKQLANPFIQLNIVCPPSSYDPNVTSLKDEVMFADEPRILSGFETMCRKIYPVDEGIDNQPRVASRHQTVFDNLSHPTCQSLSSSTDRSSTLVGQDSIHFGNDPIEVHCDSADEELLKPRMSIEKDESESYQPQDETVQSPYQIAQMRIKRRVNMARTESNTSIDTNANNTVTVQIPRLSPAREVSSDTYSKVAPTSRAARQALENIQQYFQPLEGEDFEIATDETATAGRQQHTENSVRVLKPIRDSRLNTRIEPDQSESSDFELEGLSPRHDNRGSVDIPRMMREDQVADDGGTMGFRRRTPPDRSPPSRRQLLSDVASPLTLTGFGGIRTPPLSDPRSRQRNVNSPFRSHGRSIAAGNVIQSRRSYGDIDSTMGSLGQNRVRLGRVTDQDGIREEEGQPGAIHSMVSTQDDAQAEQGSATDAGSPPTHTGGPGPGSRDSEFSTTWSVFRGANPNEDMFYGGLRGNLVGGKGGQDGPIPPMRGRLGLRGPSLNASDRRGGDVTLTASPPSSELDEASFLDPTQPTSNSSDGPAVEAEAGICLGHDASEERRRRSRHRRSTNASGYLGLDVMPHDMETAATLTGEEHGEEGIGWLKQIFSPWDPYFKAGGHGGSSTWIESLEQVRTIQGRLEEVVKRWMRGEERGITVEYLLQGGGRRAAKDKEACE